MTIQQRTELFVPLTTEAPTGGSRDFRITVIPQADRGGFKGLGEDATRQSGSTDAGPAGQAGSTGKMGLTVHQQGKFSGSKKSCEPQVLLQREGERITNIRVQCSCGQVMDLACDYGEASPVKVA